MTRPYPEDLRERALERFEAGETDPIDWSGFADQPVLCVEVESAEARDWLAFAWEDWWP